MNLSDKLDKILCEHGLSAEVVAKPKKLALPIAEPPIEPKYENLDDALKDVNDIEEDEDGIRIISIKTIKIDSINLPMSKGEYIIEDIQKVSQGYEVHVRHK